MGTGFQPVNERAANGGSRLFSSVTHADDESRTLTFERIVL